MYRTHSPFILTHPMRDTVSVHTASAIRALVLAILLFAFAFWLLVLTQRSLWTDELSTVSLIEKTDLQSVWQATFAEERRPPLYFALLWFWTRIAGRHEFVVRYFSLFFSTLSIAVTFVLVRGLCRLTAYPSNRLPLLTTLLLALSPTLALYGVLMRYYALVFWLALALNLIFVRWLRLMRQAQPRPPHESLTLFSTLIIASMMQQYETLSRMRAQRQHLFLTLSWLLFALLLIYADYSALALIGAQTFWLWLQRDRQRALLRRWAVLLVILALAYLPLVSNLLEQLGRAKQDADLSRDAIGLALRFVYPFFSFTFGETILPWHLAVLAAAPFVARALAHAIRKIRVRPLIAFALLMVMLPLLFNLFIFALVATDLTFVTMASRTLFALPFCLLVLAAGISELRARGRAISIGLLVVANLAALVNLLNGIEYHNPIFAVPLRAVSETIQRESRPGDIVISDTDIGLQYYWRQQPTDAQLFLAEGATLSAARALVQSGRAPRVWLLAFGRDRSRSNDHAEELMTLLAPHYTLREERDYAPVDPLYRAIKERLVGREAYAYKLRLRLYQRR